MANAKRYKIGGIHCEACSKVIKMDLDDAGFDEVTVDQENEVLIVPEKYVENIDEIRKVVEGAGKYELGT